MQTLKRRAFIAVIAMVAIAGCRTSSAFDRLQSQIIEIETRLNARVGVAVLDEETGKYWEHNSEDRFPMTSTFKTLACAALLVNVDKGEEQLDRRVVIQADDLVTYSPVMKDLTGPEGVTLGEACEATLATSDNTAANIVLEEIGGPKALTAFLRATGDEVTRLDRYETELNEARIGDERDTTTSAAMVATMRALILEDDVLSPASQEMLKTWLIGNQVGDPLLRAGVPSDWIIADRTGAGGNGTRAIAAVMWPPQREPIIAAIYITATDASFDDRNAAIAEIGAAIADEVRR